MNFFYIKILGVCGLFLLSACKGDNRSRLLVGFNRKATTHTNALSSGAVKLQDDHCYYANVTREEGATCESSASAKLGQVVGAVGYGQELFIETSPGFIRLDLLAFKKPGSGCPGALSVTEKSPGNFRSSLSGVDLGPSWLVATKSVQARPGDQSISLEVLGTAPGEMGVSLACNPSKRPLISGVQTMSGGQIKITGSQLEEVTRVSIPSLGTKFEIISRTAGEVIARTFNSASFNLGQVSDLIIANAHGNTTVSLSVNLANGSVRPEHLDMTADWPFPTPRSISLLPSLGHSGVSSITNPAYSVDANPNTFTEITKVYAGCAPASGPSTDGGRMVFQIGDGTTPYSGTARIEYEAPGNYQYGNELKATVDPNNISYSLPSGGSLMHTGDPSSKKVKIFDFDGTHLVFEPGCDYYAAPGGIDTVKIYDIRIEAKPSNF